MLVYRALADAVVVAHLLFVGFVVLGGLLVWRRPRLAWLHAPAAIWATIVEVAGWACPLTPLENLLRARAGAATYAGDFVERYLLPALYPASLTRPVQIGLGLLVLAINVVVYASLVARRRKATE